MSGAARFILVLLILALLSGAALVYSRHQSRQLFIELQGLQARRDELNIDWESLKLEESTLNTALMVDQAAHDRPAHAPARPGQRGVRQAISWGTEGATNPSALTHYLR